MKRSGKTLSGRVPARIAPRGIRPDAVVRSALIVVFSVASLYPLLYTIMLSLKSPRDIFVNPLWINSFMPQNYAAAWSTGHASQFLLNSVYVTGASVVLTLVVILLASFSIAFLRPKGYRIIFTIIISMLFLSAEMTTIPNFLTIRQLGLYNMQEGLILIYTGTSFAMGTYIMVGAFHSIPKELEDAAKIDGAGVLKTMSSIFIPLALPSVACVTILLFQGIWSEFYWALLLIQNNAKKTLMLGLMSFMSQFQVNYGALTAGLVIATVPILIVYIFSSNYFIKGLTAGAIKG